MRSAVRRLTRVLPSAMLGAALALTAVVPAAKAAPVDVEPTPWAAGDKTVVVDEPTITTWEGVAKDDTANVGRIWTDKSVFSEDVKLPGGIEPVIKKDDSDFLVGLSALSSTSNTITTTTSVQPLDIVLVLDVSGSMDDYMTSYKYTPTYDAKNNKWGDYWAKNPDGSYAPIKRITTGFPLYQFEGWELSGNEVEPMTGPNDTGDNKIQFYTRTAVSEIRRMAALKTAANNFITETAKRNDGIADEGKQHRISIVKFASDKSDRVGNNTDWRGLNYSQIVTRLTAYNSKTVSSGTDMINALNAKGATRADYGMEKAVESLSSARSSAQKVVIFFTDGVPTSESEWDSGVANAAISQSRELKQGGAVVYSIGVFAEADPADTGKNFNAYMHGVSSNYPGASSYRDLGTRAENSDYYKAATDADELNSIFQEISNEINSGTGSPTETTEGMANKSGYITFTDELGAYMQVDGFKTLVFADKEFSPLPKTTDGLVDTYAYEGTGGNALYPDGNVKNIVVQVKRSNDLAKGDIVTVKIPASLIPLRNFKVESNDGAANMEIVEAYPLRIFYGVSIKPGVRNAVLSGTADDALRAYIKNNSEGGKTAFYSNFYNGMIVAGNKQLGNTTATFVPSKANSFYYFTEDTALYTDSACAQPLLSKPVSDKTYYYKRAHYKQNADGKTATKDWAITQLKGSNFDALAMYWGKAPDGTYFIKAGSPRLTRIDALTLGKKKNLTGTATEVINPRWDNINNPYEINVSLGNNGKLSVEMPGTLSITKDARITPGKNIDPSVLEGKQFKFEISIPSAAGKTLKADVKNAQGEVVSEAFNMALDKDGKREQALKDNETLTIYGLDANAAYTVTEKEIPAGFTQTKATDNKGTITANEVAHAKFENTYDVAAAKPIASDDFVKYQKVFDKWEVADAFDIQLQAVQAGNPMPKGSIYGPDNRGVKIAPATQQRPTGSFGDIVFDRPGTFEYTVSEVKPAGDAMVPGVTYSQAVYKVTVKVEDDGKGALKVTSNKMTKVSNDAGGNLAESENVTNKTAVFTNTFSATSTRAAPVAYKRYTNHGGEGTALKSGMFTFKVESKTKGAPLPEGADPDGNGAFLVKNQGEEIPLAQATFGADHVGHTYVYDINEVCPDEATVDNNYTVNGMTYDPTVYRAKFQVTSDGDGDQARVKVAISYYKVDGDKEEPLPEGQTPEFNNSYDPADVTLPSDPNDAPLKARKTLVGRDSKKGESFTFELSAADNPTAFALENDVVVFNGNASATTMTASVSDLKNGQAKDAPFEKATFTKPGTYKFNIKENAPADDEGMTYDRTTHVVMVVVTDVDGVLKANVEYPGAKDAAAFTNKYEARYDLGTGFKLDVTKMLSGRAQVAGEFGFKIEGVASNTVTADEASKRLDAKEAKFETVAPADSGVPSLMENKLNKLHFTQADAGKTFSYVLREDIPAGDKKLGGVTYDETTYRIDIKVVDNANGTMGTVTTIIKNVPGAASETVDTYDSADGKDAVTLGFTNAYAAQPVTVDGTKYDLNLYKVLEGRDWREGDTFHFVMKAGNHNDPGAQKAEVDVTADPGTKAGVEVPFNFGSYTFTQPGEYYYTITEVEPAEGDRIAGITYSKNAADIVVNVTDNLKGQLEAKVRVYNGTFTNRYEAELDHNAAGGLIIAKTTNGHDMAKGQFKFQVETLDGKGTEAAETAKRLGMEDGKTTGEFGNVAGKDGERVAMTSQTPLKFTQADAGKSFVFKVSELGANGKPGTGGKKDGYTYSDAVYTIELSVVDNLDGTLTLTTKVTDKDNKTTTTESTAAKPLATTIDFVNSYAAATTDATDVDLATAATKTLDGRNMKAGEFSFEIVSNPIAEQGAEKKIATGENAAADSGKPAAVTFNKDSLSYTLEQLKTAAADTTADRYVEAGTTKDGKPQYTVHYTARELTGKLPAGVTAVKASFDFTVTVVDNGGGTLAATANYPKDGLAFTNTYTPAPVVIPGGAGSALQVKKALEGRDWLPNESYSFELKAVTKGAPMPEGAGNVAAATANNQTVSFGSISFAKPGAYEYRIVETGTSADANLTFSKAEYKLVVTVVDDGSALKADSALTQVKDDAGVEVNKTMRVPGEVMTFTNTYKKPTQGKDVTAEGKPGTSIDGQLVQVGSRLVYTINWVNDAVDETGKAVAANVTITDVIPAGTAYVKDSASEGGFYNADTNTLTWSLGKQEANASGTVSFTVEVTEAVLNNKVENQANIQIGENKTETTSKPEVFVPGKKVEDANKGDIQVGDVLTYIVSYANPGKDPATVTITDKLPKGLTYIDGSASDGGSFDKDENKLTWKINDVKAGATDTVTFEARVNESALTNGIANTANVQLGDHAPVVDTNTTPEDLPKTSALKIGKAIKLVENQGTEIDEKKEFSFKITLTDAAGNPLNENYRYGGEGLDDGVIATGKDGDTFKLKHGQAITIQGLPAGAKYTITEDDAAGYTPDKKTIEGAVSADGTSQAAFVNTYSIGDGVTLAAKDGFKAKKELVGRDWNGTDEFSAKLTSVNGAPMPDGAKDGVLVKQMTKDSKEVSFGDIKYAVAGEYAYKISEEVGSIGGIKYSDTIYNVKVKVTDKGDGTLAASFDGKYVVNGAAEDASPTDIAKFVNVYSAAVPQDSPVTTANLFSKVLTGRDWKKEDSFSFTITPLNGAPAPVHLEATLTGLTTAANDAVPFDFGTISFTFDNIKDVKPNDKGVRTKEFVYEVREIQGDIAGVEYDDNVAKLTIRLTDAGDGNLTATYNVTGKSQFTNEYSIKPINPDGDGATSKAGIQIVKTLTGRPVAAGDFKFTMAPADDVTKAKFGDAKVIATNAAELGIGELTNTAVATTPVATGLEFTLEDVGKTYKFELSETKGGGAGYVNDKTKHALTFATADNGNGTLSVTVALDGEEAAVWTSGSEITPVSVGFTNSYSAGSITVGGQGGVALMGTKQLTGRPMVAGEFHFSVTNAKDQAEPAAVVATGTNAANGTITFTGIEYTTEKLNNDVAAGLATVDRAGKDGDVYTYTYKVSEDAGRKDKGVSIVQGEQTITVKVTDNRAGKLSAKVVYPEGGMVFKNAYGTGEGGSKQIVLNGTKVLDVKSGNKVPDIAGKYTFTLAGSEGAPMPAKTTATNDASGNISFGEIIYTMENVFGAPAAQPEQLVIAEDGADTADAKTAGATDAQAAEADAKADDAVAAEAEAKPAEGESAVKAAAADEPMVASAPRSKAFTYKVTENGSVAGVTNDPVATKTITVTVTDKGDGTLTVDKQAESNKTDFTFTNTYSVKPFDSTLTGEDGFTITKKLDGRDLREGEFEFALASQVEGEQTVVTAKNDASGKVAFPAISFNAPGEYRYRLAEVDGGLGGVTYDTTVYDVTATVVDNGDGTLGVTWSVSKDGKPLEGKEIVFANSYKAAGTSITFNAAKVLTGRDLKKGEFTFELRDANGKVLQTVKNGALTEGGYAPIDFAPITYDEPGTYGYRIVEVKGDAEGVTYDETVFTYHVVVTDDGNGQLQVEWTVGETGAPVFQNVYVKPEDPKPVDPAKPADPGNGGSGDKLVQTGDNALVGVFAAALAGMTALGAGLTARRKKK